jgi:HK97 gp10 family phage protein
MSTEWNDNVAKELGEDLSRNLEAAAIYFKGKVKEAINRSQPYKRSTNTQITTHENGKVIERIKREAENAGIYYYGLDPSEPGQPPKKVTGFLQRSIAHEMSEDKTQAFVGSGLDYAYYLETGTRKMAARPFLQSTLLAEQDKIAKIIAEGHA